LSTGDGRDGPGDGDRASMSDARLAELVDRAFDYRGYVTVRRTDGSELVGFVYDRGASHIELFDGSAARGRSSRATRLPGATGRTPGRCSSSPGWRSSCAAWPGRSEPRAAPDGSRAGSAGRTPSPSPSGWEAGRGGH